MVQAKLDFPIIAKPDRGERGWLVQKINSVEDLNKYSKELNVPFLIQSYIDYPIELSIFYYRHPKWKRGIITSVTLKELLTVTGDGKNDLASLIKRHQRAFLQYKRLRENSNIDFNKILSPGEEALIVPYGNHVLGAKFLDYHHIIDEALLNSIDNISQKIDGFYFGRFDLRCTSIEDLKQGKNVAILELNGAGAEPAHIYDPNFSFIKAQIVLAKHYKMMYDASAENKRNGITYMTFWAFIKWKRAEKSYKMNAISCLG